MGVWKHIKAYPVLRRRFMRYIKGVEHMPEGWTARRLFWDYLKVRREFPLRRVSISEYFIFGFYSLDNAGRGEYLTDVEATLCMRPFNEENKEYLWDKECFLRTFSDFVHRDWMFIANATPEEFEEFARRHGVLALKPYTSSWGIGFKRLEADKVSDWQSLYEELAKGGYLAEEYLSSAPELAKYHPASLNTIRVISFCKGDSFEIFGAGLRVGNNGKLVDNAHGGGIFCEIDPATGRIITDGLDEYGNYYLVHPITGVEFRDGVIPKWPEIVELCRQACKVSPALRVTGWDVAILSDGSLELIEGNHNPGMNIVQAPAKHGVRQKFIDMLRSFYSDVDEQIRDASVAFGGSGRIGAK